jgi:hypothetical protein
MQYLHMSENTPTAGPCRKTTTSLLRGHNLKYTHLSRSTPTRHLWYQHSTPTNLSSVWSSTSSLMTLDTNSHHTHRIRTKTLRTRLRHCGQAEVTIAARHKCHLSSSTTLTAMVTCLRLTTKARHTVGEVPCNPWWKTRMTCLQHRLRTGRMRTLYRTQAKKSHAKSHAATRMKARHHLMSLGTERSRNKLLIVPQTHTHSTIMLATHQQSDE